MLTGLQHKIESAERGAHRAPAVLITIVEFDIELADWANDSVVAPELHGELVVCVKLPAAAIAMEHMHHRHVLNL